MSEKKGKRRKDGHREKEALKLTNISLLRGKPQLYYVSARNAQRQ